MWSREARRIRRRVVARCPEVDLFHGDCRRDHDNGDHGKCKQDQCCPVLIHQKPSAKGETPRLEINVANRALTRQRGLGFKIATTKCYNANTSKAIPAASVA